MADTNVAEENVEEKPTSQANPPQAEAPTTEVQTPTPPTQEAATPDDVEATMTPEQRKAFQTQRLEIKQLKEETEARKKESAFQIFRPQPGSGQAGFRAEDYTDPVTGEVNRPAYNAAVQAEQARQAAVMAQQSVTEQLDEYQARTRHPDLFEDPEIEKEIASRYLFEKMSGNNLSITEISNRVARRLQKDVSKVEKQTEERVLEEVTPKEQAALAAEGQTAVPARQAQATADLEQLRQKSRTGGEGAYDAIAERLKGIPWANK